MALSIISTVNKHLSNLVAEKGIECRKDASAGAWLSLLLPLAIIRGCVSYGGGESYRTVAGASCGILVHSLIVLARAYRREPYRLPPDLIISVACGSMAIFAFTDEGLVLSNVYSVLSVTAYEAILMPVMKICPQGFTFGEAAVVCQGFILFLLSCATLSPIDSNNCYSVATVTLQAGNICVFAICMLSYHFELKGKPSQFYSLTGAATLVMLCVLYFLTGLNPLLWIYHQFTRNSIMMWMVAWWSACCVLTGLLIGSQVKSGKKATTAIRKLFHLMLILVFGPGVVLARCDLYLATGVIFAIFIALDAIRLLKIPPFATALEDGFSRFSDEKDAAGLSLTPIYLLTGCSLPLWIHPDLSAAQLLPLLAGLISVGVGDSAASVCGSLVGKNKWPGSSKSKEGTAACFLSQLFLVIFLIHIEYVPRTNLIKPTLAIAISSFVEAKTDQVDNLVLPLLTYILIL